MLKTKEEIDLLWLGIQSAAKKKDVVLVDKYTLLIKKRQEDLKRKITE